MSYGDEYKHVLSAARRFLVEGDPLAAHRHIQAAIKRGVGITGRDIGDTFTSDELRQLREVSR